MRFFSARKGEALSSGRGGDVAFRLREGPIRAFRLPLPSGIAVRTGRDGRGGLVILPSVPFEGEDEASTKFWASNCRREGFTLPCSCCKSECPS